MPLTKTNLIKVQMFIDCLKFNVDYKIDKPDGQTYGTCELWTLNFSLT